MLKHIKEFLTFKEFLKFAWYFLAGQLFTICFIGGFFVIITIPLEKSNLLQNISLLGSRSLFIISYWFFCSFLFICILEAVHFTNVMDKFFRKIGTCAFWDF